MEETFVPGSTGSRGEPGSGAPLGAFLRSTRPPKRPPFIMVSFSGGKRLIQLYLCQRLNKRRELPEMLRRCVVSDLWVQRRWWCVCGGVFLEPPHHNRTTNPDPQDGHGQDGPGGKTSTPARAPTETSPPARVWVGPTRLRTAAEGGHSDPPASM